jgi:hypothetical protein
MRLKIPRITSRVARLKSQCRQIPCLESINKSTLMKITAAGAALFTILGTVSSALATNLTLDGSGFYELKNHYNYYSGGAHQGGRYKNFGADYYRKATIGMRWITNNSSSKNSGDMSFELWGMPYYGATKGVILMTRGLNYLPANSYYSRPERSGYAIFLNDRRFPELDLWEYTRNGWKWRDVLTFSQKTVL